jgi:tRNA(Ile)-lysidine synthase
MTFSKMDLVLSQYCGLVKNEPVLVGVSGGPDSLCLCDLLVFHGYSCVVAHFDHNLRPESHLEAKRVEEFACSRGLTFVLGSQDVRAVSEDLRLSLEEAARILRYRFLFQKAREVKAQAVAVAHTAEDQVESVLMHLLRGTGLSGLRGMMFRSILSEWDPDLPLVRPLLKVWREEILQYCDERDLQPIFDPSNLDTAFFRNRLRHELIPFLQQYNPQIKQAIWKMSQTLANDFEVLDSVVEQAWQECCIEISPVEVAIDRQKVLVLPLGIQRSVMRRAIGQLRPALRDIDFETVERAVKFVWTPTGSHSMDLAAGLDILLEGERIVLIPKGINPQTDRWPCMESQPLSLQIPGKVTLASSWEIEANILEQGKLGQWEEVSDSFQAWLDADTLAFPLEIRTRKDGDRFQPIGMEGHSLKISDFMINERMPRRARLAWPLVVSAGQIIWIPGYRPANDCRVIDETRHILHLQLRQLER